MKALARAPGGPVPDRGRHGDGAASALDDGAAPGPEPAAADEESTSLAPGPDALRSRVRRRPLRHLDAGPAGRACRAGCSGSAPCSSLVGTADPAGSPRGPKRRRRASATGVCRGSSPGGTRSQAACSRSPAGACSRAPWCCARPEVRGVAAGPVRLAVLPVRQPGRLGRRLFRRRHRGPAARQAHRDGRGRGDRAEQHRPVSRHEQVTRRDRSRARGGVPPLGHGAHDPQRGWHRAGPGGSGADQGEDRRGDVAADLRCLDHGPLPGAGRHGGATGRRAQPGARRPGAGSTWRSARPRASRPTTRSSRPRRPGAAVARPSGTRRPSPTTSRRSRSTRPSRSRGPGSPSCIRGSTSRCPRPGAATRPGLPRNGRNRSAPGQRRVAARHGRLLQQRAAPIRRGRGRSTTRASGSRPTSSSSRWPAPRPNGRWATGPWRWTASSRRYASTLDRAGLRRRWPVTCSGSDATPRRW